MQKSTHFLYNLTHKKVQYVLTSVSNSYKKKFHFHSFAETKEHEKWETHSNKH